MRMGKNMTEDRYQDLAAQLARFGFVLDLVLKGTRRAMIDMLLAHNTKSLLDACCGAGTFSRYAADAGMRVTGADLSPSMLDLARKKSPDIDFIEADLTAHQFDDQFDAAAIALAIHEMPETLRQDLWAGLKKAVKPGGVIVVADNTVTEKKGIAPAFFRHMVYSDEKNIGKSDPGHYTSFLEFMEKGGLKAWLQRGGETILEERTFLGGNIAVFTVSV